MGIFVMPIMVGLLAEDLAPADAAAAPRTPPSAACTAKLDAWCAMPNNTLGQMDICLRTLEERNSTLPMVAAFTTSKGEGARWRCYSPDNLAPQNPLLARQYHCPKTDPGTACNDACSGAGGFLEKILRKCDPSWVPPPPPPAPPCTPAPPGTYCPLTVLGAGMKAPNGVTISGASEPSLLYIPPDPEASNGTLLVVSGIHPAGDPGKSTTLGLRRSQNLGLTWSAISFPFLAFSDVKTVGSFFQNQLAWDAVAKTAHLVIGNVTDHPGGCDGGSEALNGMLHIQSSDRGATWTSCTAGSCDMPLPKSPTKCLAPTSGHGVQMTKDGPYKGRLLFMGVHNAYKGDVVAYSDDHGKSFQSSGALHQTGLDEGSIAQLPNGSLFTIFRNCFLPGGSTKGCQGRGRGQLTARVNSSATSVGGKRFYFSVSTDGGIAWTKPRAHPDLVTPVCQGSVTMHKDALLFAGPYSESSRHNLTILASDDNGVSFTRSLLITPGSAGYSGLQCGLPGLNDCAVIFDSGGHIDFVAFSSADVK